MEPNIIFENDKMIICDKPAGVLAQSNRSFDTDMVSALLTYRRAKGENVYIGVINRLDRPVSGLMVFAKSPESAAKLNALMQKDTFNKTYTALVLGSPDKKGTFTDYIVKDSAGNISRIADAAEPGAKRAELSYEVIRTKEIILSDRTVSVSLVKIRLITGRHHQIRVQFASRGHVLVGDVKYSGSYGDSKFMAELMGMLGIKHNSIALCACALDIDGKHFEINADFEKI